MDAQRFEEIYRQHYKELRRAARQLTHDADAAHDIVQEVFLRLWDKHDEFHTILNPGGYLYKSVVNACLNYLARSRKSRPADEMQLEGDSVSSSPVELKELQNQVQSALERLPPKCRAIFVLSRFEQKKNKEIAAVLNLSLKTVENQMGIALRKMRELLKPYISKDIMPMGLLFGSILSSCLSVI